MVEVQEDDIEVLIDDFDQEDDIEVVILDEVFLEVRVQEVDIKEIEVNKN